MRKNIFTSILQRWILHTSHTHCKCFTSFVWQFL